MMGWDVNILLFLQTVREYFGEPGIQLMNAISEYSLTLLVGVPMFAYWCLNKKAGYSIFLVMCGGNMTNHLVKLTTCVERPWKLEPRITPPEIAVRNQGGYSFPSGHTQFASSYLAATDYFLPNRNVLRTVFCWGLIILIAFSRVYLGVHTASDVIVGILESVLWIPIAGAIMNYAWENEAHAKKLMIIGLIALAAAMTYMYFKPYPLHYNPDGTLMTDPHSMITFTGAGAWAGLMIGLYLETKYIRFTLPAAWKGKLLRFVIGAAIYLPLYIYSQKYLEAWLGFLPGSFLSNVLCMLFPTAIYPFCFMKAEGMYYSKNMKTEESE